ncbi:hypothetical protein KXD40_003796 [Peronospora effusa]|uniref:Uncharacterized protein n=1 Tax=Peronospora effusa TaxID=542832 RepID=A0A3M6VLM8_9STRA|nr:hypothetical protein DD238_000636 [Peronospora effusa]RQM17292.1 hypothetical protein DD237_000760 [Peronospora effusa]UIZ22752.1 hypothetical protein KXD40_003796 [Peronospora effusa]CAI5703270.1 unnamed protein product [Peronospora effusa]
MSGMKAVYKFHGEVVHSFESFPCATKASNEYAPVSGEKPLNHSYTGKMDGGNSMPELKSTGPYAALVTSIKLAKEDSEGFLKDRVEGPIPSKLYNQ